MGGEGLKGGDEDIVASEEVRCHGFSYRTSHTNLCAIKIPPITSFNFSDQNVRVFSFHMKIHIVASLGGFFGHAKMEHLN